MFPCALIPFYVPAVTTEVRRSRMRTAEVDESISARADLVSSFIGFNPIVLLKWRSFLHRWYK